MGNSRNYTRTENLISECIAACGSVVADFPVDNFTGTSFYVSLTGAACDMATVTFEASVDRTNYFLIPVGTNSVSGLTYPCCTGIIPVTTSDEGIITFTDTYYNVIRVTAAVSVGCNVSTTIIASGN